MKEAAYERGRKMCEKLKEEIPRQLFEIPIQAAVGSKIIARERQLRQCVRTFLRSVTAVIFHVRRNCLKSRKKERRRMRQVGNVEIPQKCIHECPEAG